MSLDFNKLEDYRDEILKAEIGSLLFNLGKTHAGIGFWKDYFPGVSSRFSGYKKYYEENIFEEDLKNVSTQLKDFIFNRQVYLPNVVNLQWVKFFEGDASKEDFITKIFFQGCENINSGIDKGNPNKKLDFRAGVWISNAFGSFKKNVELSDFDSKRLQFFRKLHNFLNRKGYYSSPQWQPIRNFIIKEVREWYSHLLSDTRYPINDVTLFDQAYMTASMFKATLAQLVMDNSLLNPYLDKPSSIKWKILGIQYDKLGLAEKALKLASIDWYRRVTEKIDQKIKEFFEIEYPLGNEIYRDETGIYFIVGEKIEKKEIENYLGDRLKEIFSSTDAEGNFNQSEGLGEEARFYIALSKASRGLMNLPTLLEGAPKNFKKAQFAKSLPSSIDTSNNPSSICPICEMRLIYQQDRERNTKPPICEVCDSRIHHQQVKKWLSEPDELKKTIWIDEIKDRNNRVGYINLKFELKDWLSGDLLNSLIRKSSKEEYKTLLKKIISNNYYPYIVSEWQYIFNSIEEKILVIANKKRQIFELWKNIKETIISPLLFQLKNEQKNANSADEYKKIKKKIEVINSLNLAIDIEINKIPAFSKISDPFVFCNTLNKWYSRLKEYEENKDWLEEIRDIKLNFEKEWRKKLLFLLITLIQMYDKRERKKINFQIKKINEKLKNIYEIMIELEKEIEDVIKKTFPEKEELCKKIFPFSMNEELIKFFSNYGTFENYLNELFFSSISGTKWEEWLKEKFSQDKIDWRNEEIKWEKFTDENDRNNLDLLATLLLQFLLRKNPSPARLRRIWETTEEFFREIQREITEENLLQIPKWRRKRLIWEVEDENFYRWIKSTGEELEGSGLQFWAQPQPIGNNRVKLYLITSVEDFIWKFGKDEVKNLLREFRKAEKRGNTQEMEELDTLLTEKLDKRENFSLNELKLKKVNPPRDSSNRETGPNSDNNHPIGSSSTGESSSSNEFLLSNLQNYRWKVENYIPFLPITDPSPQNFQFIIPAEYIPNLIDKVIEKYDREFKFVYGKLPIHIGVVVADWKRPLYVNLQALRKIRRDVKESERLLIEKHKKEFKSQFFRKIKFSLQKFPIETKKEMKNKPIIYYSLYWDNPHQKGYNFYIKPDENWKKWISPIREFEPTDKIEIFPNTFDFEFIDTNTRRNEIFYNPKNYKRLFPLKSNRPYEIETHWEKFKKFRRIFGNGKVSSSQLHNLIHLIYQVLLDRGGLEDQKTLSNYAPLLASAFVRMLDLKRQEEVRKGIAEIFEIEMEEELQEGLREKLKERENLLLFLDMFEFWHTTLKEV